MSTDLRFVSLGFGHAAQCNMIWGVARKGTAQSQRLLAQAKKAGTYLDWTAKRQLKSLIFMTNGYVIGSPFNANTVFTRLKRATFEDVVSLDPQTEQDLRRKPPIRLVDEEDDDFDEEYDESEEDIEDALNDNEDL